MASFPAASWGFRTLSAILSTEIRTASGARKPWLSTGYPQGMGGFPWLQGSLSGSRCLASRAGCRPWGVLALAGLRHRGRSWRHFWLRIVFLDLFQQCLHCRFDIRIQLHPVLDLLAGVHDGGMVSSAELRSHLGRGVFGELPGKVHRYLARKRHSLRPPLAAQVLVGKAEIVGHDLLDELDRDILLARLGEEVFQLLTGNIQRDVFVHQLGVGDELGEGLFEVPHVRVDVAADHLDDLVGNIYLLLLYLAVEDGDARLVVRWLQVDVQSPLETAAQPVRETPDLRDRPVRGEDHLLVRVVERVEGVEQFLLGAFLALEKLDVIDEQNIHEPVLVLELVPRLFLDGENELIGECFHRDIGDLQVGKLPVDGIADGLNEMRLPEADAPIDQAGIVAGAGVSRNGERGVRGERVRLPDDEPFKGVLLVQLGMLTLARDSFFGFLRSATLIVSRPGRALLLDRELYGQLLTRELGQFLLYFGQVSLRYLVLDERGWNREGDLRVSAACVLDPSEPRGKLLFRYVVSEVFEGLLPEGLVALLT